VRHEESNTAGPSNITMSGRVAKQTDSRITIPQRFPAASREIITASITEQRIGQGDIKQNLTSTSTFFSFGQATGTAEIDAESDEWVTDGPEDWAASLTNMRESVQSCAASILGQPQHGPGARHRHTPRHTTRASGSKVYISLLPAPGPSIRNSWNCMSGCLSIDSKQPYARFTASGDPIADGDSVICST
jgi:hypothetical protein